MTSKLRPKGRTMAIIAREVALLTARLSYPPRVHHTPGVAHVLADGLSRALTDDDEIFKHPALQNAVRQRCSVRNRRWYRAIGKR